MGGQKKNEIVELWKFSLKIEWGSLIKWRSGGLQIYFSKKFGLPYYKVYFA